MWNFFNTIKKIAIYLFISLIAISISYVIIDEVYFNLSLLTADIIIQRVFFTIIVVAVIHIYIKSINEKWYLAYDKGFLIPITKLLLKLRLRPENLLSSFYPTRKYDGGWVALYGRDGRLYFVYKVNENDRPIKNQLDSIYLYSEEAEEIFPNGFGSFINPLKNSIMIIDEKNQLAEEYITGNSLSRFGISMRTFHSSRILWNVENFSKSESIFLAASCMPEFWGKKFDVNYDFPLREESQEIPHPERKWATKWIDIVYDKRTGEEVWRSYPSYPLNDFYRDME